MISVIIPVYNGEQWLSRCLTSLENQSVFNDLEIILVDDGSVDGSAGIIDTFACKYDNVRVFHIANGGVSNARNLGLKNASGEFVSFLDVDDYLDSDFYESLLLEMSEDCDILCSGFIVEYPEKTVVRKHESITLTNDKAVKKALEGRIIDANVWNKLFRRETIKEVMFDTRFALSEDKLFVFMCVVKSDVVKICSVAKYHYIMNDTSVTHLSFSEKNLHPKKVSEIIKKMVTDKYPHYKDLAESMDIDVKCSLYGRIFKSKAKSEYYDEFKSLKKDIRKFSLIKKIKNSNKKNVFSLLAAKISPRFYVYLKYNMKLQYK